MKFLLIALAVLVASCGGGGTATGSQQAACERAGGKWTQVRTYDAQGHAFDDYHCIKGS